MTEEKKKNFESLSKEEQAKYMMAYQMMQKMQIEKNNQPVSVEEPSVVEPSNSIPVINEEAKIKAEPKPVPQAEKVKMIKDTSDSPSVGVFPNVVETLNKEKEPVLSIPSVPEEVAWPKTVGTENIINEPSVTSEILSKSPINENISFSEKKVIIEPNKEVKSEESLQNINEIVSDPFEKTAEPNYTINKQPIKMEKSHLNTTNLLKPEQKKQNHLSKIIVLLIIFAVLIFAAFLIIKINNSGAMKVANTYCKALETGDELPLNQYKIGKYSYLPLKKEELKNSEITCAVTDNMTTLSESEFKILEKKIKASYLKQLDIKSAYKVEVKGTINTSSDIYIVNTVLTVVQTSDGWYMMPPVS